VATSSSANRVGRPRDLAKRAAIIEAAIGLFTGRNYEMVTMESVAAKAGVAKMTVYSHFCDKDTLFEAVVSGISEKMVRGLRRFDSEELPLRQRLTNIGTAFLTVTLNLHVASSAHSLPAAWRGDPVLRMRLYNAGPGRTIGALTEILDRAAAQNELSVDCAALAAQDLVGLWEAGLPARIAFGLLEPPTAEDVERRASRGTDIFLRAFANRN